MRLCQALGREATHTRPAKYDAEGKLNGGPRGWTCGSGGGYPALAFKGGCCKGPPECRSGSSTYFGWKPRYHDDNPARRAYTYDLEIVGSGTVTFPEASGGGTVTSHWTQIVRGFGSARYVAPAGSPRSTGRPAGNSSSSMVRRPARQRPRLTTASLPMAVPPTRADNSPFVRRSGITVSGRPRSVSASMASRCACKDRSTHSEESWTAKASAVASPGCAGSSVRTRGTSASRTTTSPRDRGYRRWDRSSTASAGARPSTSI